MPASPEPERVTASGPNDGHGSAIRAIARGGSANVGGALIAATANFLLIALIARRWAPAEAGVLFAATSILLIAIALCHLGVDQGLVRFLAWNTGNGTAHRNHRLSILALIPVLALATVVALAGWFGATSLQHFLGYDGETAQIIAVIRILAVALPAAVLYEELLAITRGYSQMRPTVVIERIVRPSLQLIGVALIANTNPTLSALAIAWVAPYGICLVLAAISAISTARAMPSASASTPLEPGVLSEFWQFTGPRGLARLAQIGIQRADIVIVSALAGPAAAAIYTSTTRFLILGQMATSALQQASEPQLAKLLGRKRLTGAAVTIRRMTVWSTALAIPLYATIAVHAEPLLNLIFGPEYAAGAALLRLLCVAMVIGVSCGPVDVLLLMAGRSTLSLANTFTALVVDVALCLALVPSMSYFGAGVAWAVAIILRNAMACVQVWRHLGVSAFSQQQAKLAGLTLALFVPVPTLAAVLTESQWIPLGISVVIGCGYLVWVWSKRHALLQLGSSDSGGRVAEGP